MKQIVLSSARRLIPMWAPRDHYGSFIVTTHALKLVACLIQRNAADTKFTLVISAVAAVAAIDGFKETGDTNLIPSLSIAKVVVDELC